MQSKKVYLTASTFEALIDRAHPKHDQASAFFRFFGDEEYILYTDINTITKTYSTIYKDISPSLGKDFMRTMIISDINILYPEEADIKAALKALISYQSNELSFLQALVAILAEKREISQICTFEYLHPLFGQTAFFLPM
jgi:predicted nucleic acid-binding protein